MDNFSSVLLVTSLVFAGCVAAPLADVAPEDVAAVPTQPPTPTPRPTPLQPQPPIELGDEAPIIVNDTPSGADLERDGESDPEPAGMPVVIVPPSAEPATVPSATPPPAPEPEPSPGSGSF